MSISELHTEETFSHCHSLILDLTRDKKIFLPGHRSVSSLKEATVSREESIVVALPSNILP